MVLSTKLAHVLNHLITSLTTYLSNSREHVAKSGKIRQKTDKRENSGHFPILSYFQKKNPDEEHFVSPKSRKINPCLVKSGIGPAGSKN